MFVRHSPQRGDHEPRMIVRDLRSTGKRSNEGDGTAGRPKPLPYSVLAATRAASLAS